MQNVLQFLEMSPLLLSLLASLSPVLALDCVTGWAGSGNDALGCLKIVTESKTWSEAVSFCHEQNIDSVANGARLFEAAE